MNSEKCIALIDDDIDDHEIFSLAMSEAAPDVACFYYDSAEAALEAILSGIPDRIYIPGPEHAPYEWYTALADLEAKPETAALKIIIYSTTILAEVKEQLTSLGAYYFFIKPFSHLDLIAILKDIMAGKVMQPEI